jgi:hypothetical protein
MPAGKGVVSPFDDRTLLDAGLRAIEVTLRTPAGLAQAAAAL